MVKKQQYTIPYVGLKKEKHVFDFQLDKEFFKSYEQSLINEGQLNVEVHFDKGVLPHVMDFVFDGNIRAECDRCLSDVDLPIHKEYRVYVKFESDEDIELDENLEIIYLHPKDQEIDLEVYLYDFSLLSVPFTKQCSDVQQECDPEVTKYIVASIDAEEEEVESSIDPRWESLKQLKKKLNK